MAGSREAQDADSKAYTSELQSGRSLHRSSSRRSTYTNDSERFLLNEARIRRRRIGWVLVLPTLLVITLTAGLGVFLLGWLIYHLFTYQSSLAGMLGEVWQRGAFELDEGSADGSHGTARLSGLVISAVTSHLISTVAPILMALLAYRIAADWLRTQEAIRRADSTMDLPTEEGDTLSGQDPHVNRLEYGILFSLLGSSSLYTLGKLTPTLWRGRNQLLRFRTVVSKCLFVTLIVYFITHAVGACDLWLHYTTTTLITNTTIPASSFSQTSLTFNDSICPGMNSQALAVVCSEITEKKWGDSLIPAYFVAANRSQEVTTMTVPTIQTLNDEDMMAIAIPTTYDSTSIFNASTIGAVAQCKSLNSLCQTVSLGEWLYGESGAMFPDAVANCTGAGFPDLPAAVANSSYTPGHPLPSASALGWSVNWPQNANWSDTQPVVSFEFPLQLVGPFDNTMAGNLSSAVNINPFSYDQRYSYALYASCNMVFYDATIHFEDGTYTLLDAAVVPDNVSMVHFETAVALNDFIVGSLVQTLQPLILSGASNETVMSALAAEFSRQLLSYASTIWYTPADSLAEEQVQTVVLGRYPVAPVLTMVSLLLVYAGLAVWIALWTVAGSKSEEVGDQDGFKDPLLHHKHRRPPTKVELMQLRLTDPMTVISEAYPEDEPLLGGNASSRTHSRKNSKRSVATGQSGANSSRKAYMHKKELPESMKQFILF